MITVGSALEMYAWQVFWSLAWRLIRRMVRNAKVDLVSELIALGVEGLKLWGLPREKVLELVGSAYDDGADGAKEVAGELELTHVSGRKSPKLPEGDRKRPGSESGPTPTPPADRPNEPGAAKPETTSGDPGRSSGGS